MNAAAVFSDNRITNIKIMPSVSLSFKVHIPYLLKQAGQEYSGAASYFDDAAAKKTIDHLADEAWLPANKILLAQTRKHEDRFKVAFSISSTAIELLQQFRPDVIRSFRKLAATGCVEFFAETSHNSLSWLYSKNEFRAQVRQHHQLIKETFGMEPLVFRNTELIYNNELAAFIAAMGYKGIMCEGLGRILQGRNCNQVYAAPGLDDFPVLLRNVRLSDDVAFRFDDPTWNEQPLTAEKFASWIHSQENSCITNIFFNYETFGVYKKAATGIFEFLEHLPAAVLNNENWRFATPSESVYSCYPKDIYNVPSAISWEGKEKECCVWSDNTMQHNALKKIYSLERMVKQSGVPGALECWQRLLSADYFYYMCSSGRPEDDAYKLMNPFSTAAAAYQQYMNVLTDFEIKLIRKGLTDIRASYSRAAAENDYSAIY